MDFKALRAKFQDEELLLKQPKIKPALPEKPKVVPPPQSPPHYLPAGARPSLLTSINQSLEGKTVVAPRVIFKDEKKESKKPLILTNMKGKDKTEGKLKGGKDKTTKGSKEKLDVDSSDQKQKKESSKDKKFPLMIPVAPKENTAELVSATPPPKATASKKKTFLGFRKTSRTYSLEVPADPILDMSSSDVPGPAPLIPVPSDLDGSVPEPLISAPKALIPNIPTLSDSTAAIGITPPFIIPASPDFTPPPAFIPEAPAPVVPIPQSETQLEIETPAQPVSRPASQTEIIASPPSVVPTPPPSHAPPASSSPPPVASTSTPPPSPPEPEMVAVDDVEAVNIDVVEKPTDTSSIPPSPKPERPISALSVLERAEDMSPGKRTLPCDQRIFNALEKARKKSTSPFKDTTTSYSVTPPPEELSPPHSPTHSLPELPPIDYEDRAGNARSLKPEQVNGIDHGQASVLEGVTEEVIPELLVVPPPPPRRIVPSAESEGLAPETPARPPSVTLNDFIPPPPFLQEIPAPAEFLETDTTDIPEFDDLASDAHSPELLVSEWGNEEFTDLDTPDGQNLPDLYCNRITAPEAEVQGSPVSGDEYQENPQSSLPDSSFTIAQDFQTMAEPQADVGNGIYESTENVYEDVRTSSTKKKGKNDKKRKGPPKNTVGDENVKKTTTEGPDEKEQKKKEKQRLEKEKKELKEKQEREKKEQKEKEKKENEMKKKFKITGHEDAMYQAKVTVTTKGRKNDLPINSGDIVSIIRTTNCPKGKWLARDSGNNYGYIAVDHVELDIKEMLELGKKAAITRMNSSNVLDAEVASTGSRTSNHYPVSAESFEDDSEEWTCDDDDPLSSPTETADPLAPIYRPISSSYSHLSFLCRGHTRALSMPDMGNKDLSIIHQHSQSDISADGAHVQARHEALQKLATFFHSPKPVEQIASSTEPETRT
ncbi:hypothetical protein PAMP_024706 [Pampus punctatissimus]